MTGLQFYFEFSVLASHCGRAKTEGFGDASIDTICDWLRHSHVTILQKETNLYISCMYLWASTICHYFDMDNKLQPLLTLLSLLAAVVQLNSAFHHATTANMHRRKDITQWPATVPMPSGAISPTLVETTSSTELWLVPEEWQASFLMLVQTGPDWPEQEQQHYGHPWMFSQRWPACCINV